MHLSKVVPFFLPGLFAFAGLGAALAASSACAQSTDAPVASSQTALSQTAVGQPQAAAAQSDSIDQQISAWTQDPAAHAANPGTGDAPPRQIHGEAGVAFGSSGYRSGYIATDIPIGKNSDLGIAVGETDFKPRHYGEVRNRSIAISLQIGTGAGGAPVSCASPTAPMDGRYLEPVWASRLHGEALARDQANCDAPTSYRAPVGSGPIDASGDAAE